jgi:hypothetical protein
VRDGQRVSIRDAAHRGRNQAMNFDDHAVEPADAPEFALAELETAGQAG